MAKLNGRKKQHQTFDPPSPPSNLKSTTENIEDKSSDFHVGAPSTSLMEQGQSHNTSYVSDRNPIALAQGTVYVLKNSLHINLKFWIRL